MIIFSSVKALLNRAPFELWNGNQDFFPEIPERIENILKSIKQRDQFELREITQELPLEFLERIHDTDYIKYIQRICSTLGPKDYRYPSVFPFKSLPKKPESDFALLGYYSLDLSSPLLQNTYNSAIASASLSWTLAQEIRSGKIRVGYGLCRPPGHHAEVGQMGGYCYFNNAAVAAEYFSQYGKVAVLDVDFHHGNGTQAIFYKRSDVMTVSIHADPAWEYPFYAGFESEKGEGEGEGYNHNFVLYKGTCNEEYQEALDKACKKISDFKPDYLVVPFGADTFGGDPIGGFSLTTEYYKIMGQTINNLDVPTAILQEGGYNCEELGDNVVSFLSGFEE